MTINNFKKYIITLEKSDIDIINTTITEKGIEGFFSQQLVYLDCSRIVKEIRITQTTSFKYRVDISRYLHVINSIKNTEQYDIWLNKLITLHNNNLEYEKENPPIIYDKPAKKAVTKINKNPARRDKVTKNTSNENITVSESLKSKLVGCVNVKFNIKLKK